MIKKMKPIEETHPSLKNLYDPAHVFMDDWEVVRVDDVQKHTRDVQEIKETLIMAYDAFHDDVDYFYDYLVKELRLNEVQDEKA